MSGFDAGYPPYDEGPLAAIDCICTVEQVKAGMHHPDCEWCNAGFECNPDLSDPDDEGVR